MEGQFNLGAEEFRHTVLLKRPASYKNAMWQTALPAGNGLTGVLMYGAVAQETIHLNRHDLWYGGETNGVLPDVSDTLKKMRGKILEGRYKEANSMLSDALTDSGYREKLASPYPIGILRIHHICSEPFSFYRRGIRMNVGELYTQWKEGETACERRLFVSRDNDIIFLQVRGVVQDTYTLGSSDMAACPLQDVEEIKKNLNVQYFSDGTMIYVTSLRGKLYGAVGRIIGKNVINGNKGLSVSGDHIIAVKTFCDVRPEEALAALYALPNSSELYTICKKKNLELYEPLYHGVSIELAEDEEHRVFNETMLDEAYDDKVSPAMLERLWRFGRYLFISGTSETGNPFPLYGLWHGDYNLLWTQHVANENVQLIYHHADVGGLSYSVRGLIRYYNRMIPIFEENARKLFGCPGIYIPAYTAPECGGPSVNVPVILNWISCAGWLSAHFVDYYRYTGDQETLLKEILPFLYKTAQFYEEYITVDEGGKCVICPSVSPENTPGNLMPEEEFAVMGHPCPVVRDALMDHSILRELLVNLISLSKETGIEEYLVKVPVWEEMLKSLPEYMINDKGAVKEWVYDGLNDNYAHRHLSHLYPVYPGNQMLPNEMGTLMTGFRKAVSLREIGSQSGWSYPHMACIYVRLGMGDEALKTIDLMAKACLLENFFTVHNDWRSMGVSLEMADPPIQLDALMGTIEVVQELMVRYVADTLYLLPVSVERLKWITVKNIRFPGGSVSFTRTMDSKLNGEIVAERNIHITVVMPGKQFELTLHQGQKQYF